MVLLLIKHLLRWGDPEGRAGIFGHTAAYYGTVEQQGRMTLHLHMLVWIVCALSPQQVRDRLMAKDSEFVSELISYLEGSHTGDFFTGSLEDMSAKFSTKRQPAPKSDVNVEVAPDADDSEEIDLLVEPLIDDSKYPSGHDAPVIEDPIQKLPVPPPLTTCPAVADSCTCEECSEVDKWLDHYRGDRGPYTVPIQRAFLLR
ncbi:hypothetical protein D9611_013938 [Ephemerocybe angulata]|uniref:Helitron helicase-like domain-containing protein n=1 Tax=Ephemerocybe angulata TaxID=980116 RepID=A0A8H5ERN6_9AGAR|nr:hypothetical protein D9611_013938 [Tulosesus angulatus]